MITRRHLLIGSAAVLIAGAVSWPRRTHASGQLLSAFEDASGDQYVGGVDLPTGDVFGARIPVRAHGCAIDPRDPARVLFFARRPGTTAFELRLDTLQLRRLFDTPDETVRFDGYVASVATSREHAIIAAACPYGGGIACWSRADRRYLGFVKGDEPYGVSRLADGSLVASQRDGLIRTIDETGLQSHFMKIASEKPIRWDDHCVHHSHG